MLDISWARGWAMIEAEGSGEALMRELVAAYQEPHRKYHQVQHLIECLTIFDAYRGCAQEPGEVEMALWFHDAVYHLKAFDNEAMSARWAAQALGQAGVCFERIDRITHHILATKHAALPKEGDQALLVDIDLAILGATPERFEEYERQVRQEYAFVPSFVFRRQRKKLLKAFLARPQLYATPALRARFDAQARTNIAMALTRLGG